METLETNPVLEKFWNELSSSQKRTLVLDYDGTLAPFCQDRFCAFPYPGVRQALCGILESGHTRVAMVTGRPASELIALLGLSPFPEIWGLHGMERLLPDGQCRTYPLHGEDLQVLAEAGAWLDYQGLWHLAEFKTGSIAVHWRGMSQEDAATIAERVRKGWNRLLVNSRMKLLDFDGGIEIRLSGRNKAHAVLTLLDEIGPGFPLAYLGDDRTDEDAFTALRDCPQTLTVLVRPQWRETTAKAWIKPPDELLKFFDRWLDCCGGVR